MLEPSLGAVAWDALHEYAGEHTLLLTDSTRAEGASFRVILTMNNPLARHAAEVDISPADSPLRGAVYPGVYGARRAFGFNPRSVMMTGRTIRLNELQQIPNVPASPTPGPPLELTLERGGRLGFVGRWRPVLEGAFRDDTMLARRGGTYCAIRTQALQQPLIAPDSMSHAIIDVVFTALVQQMAASVVTNRDTASRAVRITYPHWGDQAHWARRTGEFLALLNGRDRTPDDRGEFVVTIETPTLAGRRLAVLITLGGVGYCKGKPWSSWDTRYAMYSSVEYRGRLARPVMVTLVNSDGFPRDECELTRPPG